MNSFAMDSKVYRSYRYAPGSCPIHQGIKGRAFFPGGRGLCHGVTEPATNGVILLGHNFDANDSYDEHISERPDSDEVNPTWSHIDDDYLTALPVELLFFTNYFLGARTAWPKLKRDGKQSNQGAFPHDDATLADAKAFFLETIQRLKPAVVVVFGAHIPRYVVPEWRGRSIRYLRALPPLKTLGTTIISAYHPSAHVSCTVKKEDAFRVAGLLRNGANESANPIGT